MRASTRSNALAGRLPGWILVAGCALTALGLARASALQGGGDPGTETTQVLGLGGGASADSNNRMIAVTGSDITGASILYLVDTETMRLAVYQARGGGDSMQEVKLVGARRIDLDLLLDGFNDSSKYDYKTLREQFLSQGLPIPGGQ
jgi:hypothetical protein